MKFFWNLLKKYKYLFILNICVIILIIIFPMKESQSKFLSGTNRVGIILEPNMIVSQKFVSKLDNIERISLMMTTTNKSLDCDVKVNITSENKKIIEKKINNRELDQFSINNKVSASFVNYYLDKPIYNTKGKEFNVNISTNCDNVVKVYYYEINENEEKAIYNGEITSKKVPVLYVGTKKSYYNYLYPIVLMIISFIIALGGKNEKK